MKGKAVKRLFNRFLSVALTAALMLQPMSGVAVFADETPKAALDEQEVDWQIDYEALDDQKKELPEGSKAEETDGGREDDAGLDAQKEEGEEESVDQRVVKDVNLNSHGNIAGICDPLEPESREKAWTGTKVYFGSYNGKPLLFRVLDAKTSDYSEDGNKKTMFLDSDALVAWVTYAADGSAVWSNSDFKTWMNSEEGLLASWSAAEKNALTESVRETETGLTEVDYPAWVPLTGEKVFALDIREITNPAYGYSEYGGGSTDDYSRNRIRTGAGTNYIESFALRNTRSFSPENLFFRVENSIGQVSEISVTNKNTYASPALNLDLDKVLFTTASSMGSISNGYILTEIGSGHVAEDKWNLTLLDDNLSFTFESGKLWSDGTIDQIKYSCSEGVNRITAMITDGEFDGEDTQVLYYGELATEKQNGTKYFKLPSVLPESAKIYLLAENAAQGNGVTLAAKPYELNLEVLDQDSDRYKPGGEIAKPIADFGSLYYVKGQTVGFTSKTYYTKIYYTMTTDGTEPVNPTKESTLYSDRIVLPQDISGEDEVKIKAVAVLGNLESEVAAYTFRRIDPQVETQKISVSYRGETEVVNPDTMKTRTMTYIQPVYGGARFGTTSVELSDSEKIDKVYIHSERNGKPVSAELFYNEKTGAWETQSQFIYDEVNGGKSETANAGSLTGENTNAWLDYPPQGFFVTCKMKSNPEKEIAVYSYSIPWIIDPSGYVYEAVPSNRISGATAEISYAAVNNKNKPQIWNAEDYNQVNPQITDASGCYGWDVPNGYWRVKVTKEGYESETSNWLPVPPPQLDVNIAIVDKSAPVMKEAELCGDKLHVRLSKYVKKLTYNSFELKKGDETITIKNVSPLNEEDGLASKYEIVLNEAVEDEATYTLTILRGTSYAGTAIEKHSIDVKPSLPVKDLVGLPVAVGKENDTFVYEVSVLSDEEGNPAVGRQITCEPETEGILQIESCGIVGSDGKAEIKIKGLASGATALKIGVEGSAVSGSIDVTIAGTQEQLEQLEKVNNITSKPEEKDPEDDPNKPSVSENDPGNKPGNEDDPNKPSVSENDPSNKPGNEDDPNKPSVSENDPGNKPGNKPGVSDNDIGKKPDDGKNPPAGSDDKKPTEDKKDETVAAKKLTVSGISKKIAAGKKITLTAKIDPENATDKTIVWKSSNTKYATVDAKGVVKTLKKAAGKKVTITVSLKSNPSIKATYKITIMKDAVKSIKLSAAKSVKAGKSVTVKANVKTTGKKVNKTLAWTSSNTKYATVTKKGVVKTKKAGKGKTVTITAKATDGSGKKATTKIKIK